tara:strand:- start:7537 stop:9597 length:2061 start_codon:yes stop_codon:yes gene_type:complete
MIPQFNITGQSVNPEEIVDIIPEQEKSDAQIQANEENYFRQLQQVGEDKLRNDAKLYEGLADLSSTFGDIIKKRQDKYRADREAEISLEILTRGVSPELEARFRGERSNLFDDDIATQEFASKYEEETGDSITAQEFRKMAGWEKYMVAEQYALQKAKDYDQYVYKAYETTKIEVIRDGQRVSVGHMDNLTLQEQAALDTKIKFEYAKQFAGLNPALVATVVKPEIDKFDEMRRTKQAVAREENYQTEIAASDSRMIQMGFVTANPEDGHQLAHDWAARYAARNRTTIGAGRRAFADNLVSLVSQNAISYGEAMSIVNHEITARDGSTKTMGSWKEWAGLEGELADAAKQGAAAAEEAKENQIAGDLSVIKSLQAPTNEQKAQLYAYYKNKYDGYVPIELSDALKGHLPDDVAEDMIAQSLRYQDGVYDYEMANVSTAIFNKYKDKILTTGALVPGTDLHDKAAKFLKAYTDRGTGDTFGSTETASVEWLNLYAGLEEVFNSAYKQATVRDGQIVGRPEDGMRAGQAAVVEILNDERAVDALMNPSLDPSDNTYSRSIQKGMKQSSNGQWRKQKINADKTSQQELLMWSKTPLKQSRDIPAYYRDLAMRIGVNPIDLANSQLKFYTNQEVDVKPQENKFNDKILNLIYKFPTRSRITRAKLEDEGAGNQNVKTSIYNKKAVMRQNQ